MLVSSFAFATKMACKRCQHCCACSATYLVLAWPRTHAILTGSKHRRCDASFTSCWRNKFFGSVQSAWQDRQRACRVAQHFSQTDLCMKLKLAGPLHQAVQLHLPGAQPRPAEGSAGTQADCDWCAPAPPSLPSSPSEFHLLLFDPVEHSCKHWPVQFST